MKLTIKKLAEIKDLLKQGRRLEAVKLYKDITGKGLKESKAFIDNLPW